MEKEKEITRPLDKYTEKFIEIDQRLNELKNKIKSIDNQNIDFERMKNINSKRKDIVLDSSSSNVQIFQSAIKEYDGIVTDLEGKIQDGKLKITDLLIEVGKAIDAKDRIEGILDASDKDDTRILN